MNNKLSKFRNRVFIAVLFCLGFSLFSGGVHEQSGEAASSPTPLKIGIMPAVNSVPLIVAQHLGIFEEEGVQVELQLFTNQMYRESALQTNEIDGSISDLINAISAIHNGFPLRVTSSTEGRFALVTSPNSGITSIEDWNNHSGNINTGLLEQSIVNYVTESMLTAAGADSQKINLVSILQMPVRIEMLLNDQIQAACLPEPLTRIAAAGGAHILTETTLLPQTPGVLLFTESAIEHKAASIRAFYRGYNRAVEEIENHPGAYTQIIMEATGFPAPVERTMVLPTYGPAHLPKPETFSNVIEWMIKKGFITKDMDYNQVITQEFAGK